MHAYDFITIELHLQLKKLLQSELHAELMKVRNESDSVTIFGVNLRLLKKRILLEKY